MLEVIASRTVTSPEYQTFSTRVVLNGYEKLTPKAARAALTIAFGNDNYGDVYGDDHGYRIYSPKSCRKITNY